MLDVRRRELITLLGGAAAAWPLAARAQQPGRLPTIGVLGVATASAWNPWVMAFIQRLRELGWIEGRTVAIEYRWAIGRPIEFLRVSTSQEIDSAFVQTGTEAILVGPDALFYRRLAQITTLAARHAVAAIYPWREAVQIGGLMSYGSVAIDLFRQTAIYAGRILKGEMSASGAAFTIDSRSAPARRWAQRSRPT
jgi:hypothetical protein